MKKSTLFGCVSGLAIGRVLNDLGIEWGSLSHWTLFILGIVLMGFAYHYCKD